jgi:hypothetical protein
MKVSIRFIVLIGLLSSSCTAAIAAAGSSPVPKPSTNVLNNLMGAWNEVSEAWDRYRRPASPVLTLVTPVDVSVPPAPTLETINSNLLKVLSAQNEYQTIAVAYFELLVSKVNLTDAESQKRFDGLQMTINKMAEESNKTHAQLDRVWGLYNVTSDALERCQAIDYSMRFQLLGAVAYPIVFSSLNYLIGKRYNPMSPKAFLDPEGTLAATLALLLGALLSHHVDGPFIKDVAGDVSMWIYMATSMRLLFRFASRIVVFGAIFDAVSGCCCCRSSSSTSTVTDDSSPKVRVPAQQQTAASTVLGYDNDNGNDNDNDIDEPADTHSSAASLPDPSLTSPLTTTTNGKKHELSMYRRSTRQSRLSSQH